jgi:AcrR family transcriptional regulator
MEAASQPRAPAKRRDLAGDKAQRIVDAMRASVARRGAAGSTFDHVAREAGVSRGLLHYYFGTKERLLVEVVRRDTDIRMAALDASLAGAHTAEDLIDALVRSLEDVVENDPDFVTLWFELFTVSRRNEEIGAEVAELTRRSREHVAEVFEAKQREGVLRLHDEPDAVATILFSLADGIAMRMLLEPERDFDATLRAGIACARALLTDGE